MLKVYEIMENVDVQSEVKFVRYDYGSGERVELSSEEASGCEIRYMYVERDVLFLEVEVDDETW